MKKSILITGSTDGIGKLAAKKLATEGHSIYIHGRNPEKVKRTIEEIKNISGNTEITGLVADFSDLNAVSKLADTVKDQIPNLDVLINNAGVYKSTQAKTEFGLDLRFVVNYLAPVLFTNKLLPIIKKSKSPRIVNLSSAAQAPVQLSALEGKIDLTENQSYAQSKLAIAMWSFNLSKENEEILTIALNPGSLLNTRMVKEAFGEHWSPADKGGNIIHELATSDQYSIADSGKYFDNDKGNPKGEFGPAHANAYDEELITELILATNRILSE